MRRLNPTAIALLGGVLVLVLLLAVFVGTRGGNSDKLSDDQVAGKTVTNPEKACASQHTYDLIKRELFRSAAALRGTDQPAFDKLASYSVVRMDAPMLKSHDGDLGSIACTGTLSLDLPPGVAVVGGRRTLTADIDYGIQPAADGSGDVLTLASADAIITPLATLARIGVPADQPPTPTAPADQGVLIPPLTGEPAAPAPATPAPPGAAPRTSTPGPSFNCQYAKSRNEIAVCNDAGLASLDRQMAAQFAGAMAQADPAERARLQSTRSRFIAYRDGCRSGDCIADAYRGRMREIRDILAGTWRSPD
ncbi:MAG: hypothetical protein ABI422_00510 [Sphingomicrobium sp.]